MSPARPLSVGRLRRRERACAPWTPAALKQLVCLNVVGIALVLGTVHQLNRIDTTSEQLSWFNLALGGAVLAVGADIAWLYFGRQSIRMARLELLPTRRRPRLEGQTTFKGSLKDGRLVVLADASGSFFHRPSCQLVNGKDTRPASSAATIDRTGEIIPCGVCQP